MLIKLSGHYQDVIQARNDILSDKRADVLVFAYADPSADDRQKEGTILVEPIAGTRRDDVKRYVRDIANYYGLTF